MKLPRREGFCLRCDRDGVLREIVDDGAGIARSLTLGQPFAACAYVDNREIAQALIDRVPSEGAVYEVPISIDAGGHPKLLMVSAALIANQILILAAAPEANAGEMYEDLMRINNEETNALR